MRAAFDAAQRRLASGDDELVPAAIADRLLARDSAVRVWREDRVLAGKSWFRLAFGPLPRPDRGGADQGPRLAEQDGVAQRRPGSVRPASPS